MEEKKISSRFYKLSLINVIPAIYFGGGLTLDTLVLIAALVMLMLNHTLLVKIVQSVTESVAGANAEQSKVGRILILLGLKFLMLFSLIGLIYFYKKELVIKLFMIIFFQLIIQVVSIKNNY